MKPKWVVFSLNKLNKDKNLIWNFTPERDKVMDWPKWWNVPHFEITKITTLVLVHCNSANNDYQQHSSVLYSFAPNKSFD